MVPSSNTTKIAPSVGSQNDLLKTTYIYLFLPKARFLGETAQKTRKTQAIFGILSRGIHPILALLHPLNNGWNQTNLFVEQGWLSNPPGFEYT